MRLEQNLADAHALPSKIVCDLQRLWNNWHFVTRTLFGRRGRAQLCARKSAMYSRRCICFLVALGFGSAQVGEEPHARLADAAGAAVHEEAAPAKGRRCGRLDTELKLMNDVFEHSANAYSIVTVP